MSRDGDDDDDAFGGSRARDGDAPSNDTHDVADDHDITGLGPSASSSNRGRAAQTALLTMTTTYVLTPTVTTNIRKTTLAARIHDDDDGDAVGGSHDADGDDALSEDLTTPMVMMHALGGQDGAAGRRTAGLRGRTLPDPDPCCDATSITTLA